MSTPVLVRHDPGCRYARPEGGGHSDAAKRVSDHYNLHVRVGAQPGSWLAFALEDGTHDGTAYETKADAVRHQHHNEWRFGFVCTGAALMTVCEAESLLYMRRMEAKLHLPDLGDKRGGLDVIARLTVEDHERQVEAIRTGTGLIGLGYRK